MGQASNPHSPKNLPAGALAGAGSEIPKMTEKLQKTAMERGHGTQTAYAGVGGFLGGILGSFRGPLGAGVGALFGALLGALLGWSKDQKNAPRLTKGQSQSLARGKASAREVIDVSYVEVETVRSR
ncbi:MAG: glycine zipper domain-containing protein [Myxococcota bacterium]